MFFENEQPVLTFPTVLLRCYRWATKFKLDTAALREKEELHVKWGEILRVAKVEKIDIDSRCASLRGRSALLRERRTRLEQEVANSRAQLPPDDAMWVDGWNVN